MLRPCRVRIVPLVCFALLAASAQPAAAAKWTHGCPGAKERLKKVDYISGAAVPWLYAHIGHDIVLRTKFPTFSTDPDGNSVELTFTPINGDPIPLPPFTVTAVSATTLQFPAPDTRPTLGRLVVGPMKIVVTRGGTPIVDMGLKYRIDVLPPMNDMRALADANGAVDALGTVSSRRKFIYVPFTFEEYGEGNPLPGCPTSELSPVALFAADFSLKKNDDEIVPNVNFKQIKKAKMFFGDYDIFGVNLYGQKLPGAINAGRVPGGGVAICAWNDTYELVMAIPLGSNVTNPSSDLLPLVIDGSPLVLHFTNITGDSDLSKVTTDSTKNICPVPTAATPTPTPTPTP